MVPRLVRLLSVAVVAALALGCSSEDPAAASADGGAFPASPLASVTSKAGAYAVEVRTAPAQPPESGTSSAEYTVRAGGAPATGLTVTVTPWMPSMGHGTSTAPTVREVGDGRYVAEPIDLFMAGRWELRATLAGAVTDDATVAFDVR